MRIRMKKLYLTLVSAFVIGMLATAVGILEFDGPHSVSADSDPESNTPATGAPVITGAAQLGETLFARTTWHIDDEDGMTYPVFRYQWISRDGTTDTDIEGATSNSYDIAAADVGKTIKVRVSFTDDAGNLETLTSVATVAVLPERNSAPTGAPTIGGTAQVGQTLTVDTSGIADEDGLTNALFGGTWSADEGYLRALIGQGEDLGYTVSRRDVGLTLDVQVNFKDDAGETHFLESAKTAVVAATSPAAPESFVASVTDPGDVNLSWEAPTWDLRGEIRGDQTWGDGGSPITGYVVQWKEESDSWATEADVSEATVTGTSHTIQGLTGGTDYTTRVIAVNGIGRGAPSDESTVTVTRTVNVPPTGAPTISGTAQVGKTLTANTSGISDADGLTNVSYSYQWLADNNEISGATSSTYTLRASDKGKVIKVQVSFTDDEGYEESLTSAATAAVTNVQGPTNTDPEFDRTTASRSLVEGTAAGDNIGVPLTATDANGDTLTYTLRGTDAASFDIDDETGQIMTTAASAVLATGTYHVTVRVDDGKGGTDTIAVTIAVTELSPAVARYDADNDGSISRPELLVAIRDLLIPADPNNPVVTKAEVLELIQTHLFG